MRPLGSHVLHVDVFDVCTSRAPRGNGHAPATYHGTGLRVGISGKGVFFCCRFGMTLGADILDMSIPDGTFSMD